MNEIALKTEDNNDFESLVNPREFGIETESETRVPILQIPDETDSKYNQIIKSEITPEVCEQAKELLKTYTKVRTTIDKVHKLKKEQHLRAGQEVDKWKNESKYLVTEREEKLVPIKEHYQRLEQQRIKDLTDSRIAELSQYGVDGNANQTIAIMSDEMWDAYLIGVKVAWETKQQELAKAEAERLEKEQKEKAEREAQRIENERLKADADKREAEIKAERQANELKAKKEREESEAKLKIEREAKAKLEAELKAKAGAEAKAESDRLAQIENDLLKGDSDKVKDLVSELESIKTNAKYQFKSKKNKKMFTETCSLIDKLIIFVQK